jgi:predicted nucleic acid-binding protein
VIIADTSGLLAFYNKREPAHDEVRRVVATERDPLVVSPFVIAELEYLLATRVGVDAAVAVIHELSGGAYELAQVDDAALAECATVMERYADQQIGVTDASLVVLAQRFGTKRLLTLDRRHFSVVRPIAGGRFVLLPV